MKTNDSQHQLNDFFSRATREMADDYAQIRKDHSRVDAKVAGNNGELNWINLLKKWLPSNLQYAQNVRILNADGNRTKEIDFVILEPGYPLALAEKNEILSGAVIASFECKLTLRKRDLGDIFEKCENLKSLTKPKATIDPAQDFRGAFPHYVVSHSSEWKSEPVAKIYAELLSSVIRASHPRNLVDGIYVADAGGVECRSVGMPPVFQPVLYPDGKWVPGPDGEPFGSWTDYTVCTMPMWFEADGIRGLVLSLFKLLRGKSLLSDALNSFVARVSHIGGEGHMRHWPLEMFDERTQSWIKNNKG